MTVKNLTVPVRVVIPVKYPQPLVHDYKYEGFCRLMLNVHLVASEVNESALFIHIKPNLKPNATNATVPEGEVGMFVFMNKGEFIFSRKSTTIIK